MLIDQEIMPIILDNNFIPYIGQYNDNHSRKIRGLNFSLEDIKSFFLTFSQKTSLLKELFLTLINIALSLSGKYRIVTERLLSNNGKNAELTRIQQNIIWIILALKDSEGNKCDLIIPGDPATIFVWYCYEVYCWEEIGSDFESIFMCGYMFLFPHLTFEIPSREDIDDEKYNFLYNNYDKFAHGITMGKVVELILLYKNETHEHRFFEPDIPTQPVCCNLEWQNKLVESGHPV